MAERTIPFGQLAKAGYNRGIRRSHVNKIKRNFREDMVKPVIVSFRNGRYYVIDGQHTALAIFELSGNDLNVPIKCDVRTGLTYEEEADLYYRINTSNISLSFGETLIGCIEAKDAESLRFRDVVESCGYVVGSNTNNSINALSTAWKLFKKDNGEHLTRVLSLTRACWPGNKGGVDSRILSGISMFLRQHGDEYRNEHFIKMLSAEDPKNLIKKADSLYAHMDSRAYTKPYCMYSTILTCYNTRLRNKLIQAQPGV